VQARLGVDLLSQDRHLCLQLFHAVALARRRRRLPAPRAPQRGCAAVAVARALGALEARPGAAAAARGRVPLRACRGGGRGRDLDCGGVAVARE
jgi:hypothetical protein